MLPWYRMALSTGSLFLVSQLPSVSPHMVDTNKHSSIGCLQDAVRFLGYVARTKGLHEIRMIGHVTK